jgi:hypothetical protein
MDRHEERDDQRQAHAVQDVEPEQGAFADERAAEQREPGIILRVNQGDVAELQERRARTLVPEPTVMAKMAS